MRPQDAERLAWAMTPAHDTPVIGYVRVSTDEQGVSGLGLEDQRHQITEAAAHKGWRLIGIEEDVQTGRSVARRPGLAACLEQLESKAPGAPKALIVAKLDRMSRSVVDGGLLFDRSSRNGWAIVALDFDIDTSTASGRLVANVLTAVGEWERMVISERTRAALAAKKRRGERVGRPKGLDHTTVTRIRELRATGLSYNAVADALNAEGVRKRVSDNPWIGQDVYATLKRYGMSGHTTTDMGGK